MKNRAEIYYSGSTVEKIHYHSVEVNPMGDLNGIYFKDDENNLIAFFPEGYAFVKI